MHYIEYVAGLEDELSQLRMENDRLKLELDGWDRENAQLKARLRQWELEAGAELTEAELAARPRPTGRLVCQGSLSDAPAKVVDH